MLNKDLNNRMKSLSSPIKLPMIFEEEHMISFKESILFLFVILNLRFQIAFKGYILFILREQGIKV